jgi:O-acetyl-ADP-ribose deacetylase
MESIERIRLVQGDITQLAVDAVVTAANESLCGGGGVDGAIHRAAGHGLLEECRTLGICHPGDAKITRGYLLPARYVIHTVGPVWDGGGYGEAEILRSCYAASLGLAAEHQIASVAFPCIATGVYLYPKDEACEIAVEAVRRWLKHEWPREIVFCCFEDDDVELYERKLGRAAAERTG